MRDAYPGFQHDGAFQFAEDGGFQTQPAGAALAVEAVVSYAPSSAFVSAVQAAPLDLVAVVTYAPTSRGIVPQFVGGGGAWEFPSPRRGRADLDLVAVVTWTPSARFHPAPRVRRRPTPTRRRAGRATTEVVYALTYAAPARGYDYVREWVVPDDDDVLVLSARRFARGVEDEDLVLLVGGRS